MPSGCIYLEIVVRVLVQFHENWKAEELMIESPACPILAKSCDKT